MERSDQPPDDKELWQDFVLKGREESFHLLVQRHKLGLFNAAYRILYDTHAAEDIVQRVFVAFIERKNELANVGSLQCWLYRATFNQAINMKKLRRRTKDRERVAETPSTPETPRETAVRTELREELDRALAKLKHSLRIPVILRYLQGMSQAETSEILSLSSEATRKRITRALKRLRKLLTGRGLLLSLLAVEEGLRAIPAKAASANFLTSTSSLLNAASTGAAAGEAAISSTALITGVTIMTAKVKIAIGIIAVLALALLLTFTLRSTHRERRAAPPRDETPRQIVAKKPSRPRTAAPHKGAPDEVPSYDELEEVPLGSISGRLVDTEGKGITGLETTLRFALVGQGTYREFDVQRDGTYCVEDLPEGAYWIRLFHTYEFSHKGQRYCLEKLPGRVPVGTRDADIVVVSPNPGAIRGNVLYAGTMQPVTQFTVCQKYDLNSAPERSRRSALYREFAATSGYPGHGYIPLVESYSRLCDRLQEQMGALEPQSHQDQIEQLAAEYNELRRELEKYRLDVVSRDGVFERSGYLLGEHIFTVLADGCLPKSVEVGLYDSRAVEVTFLMDHEGSRIVGKVQDDSGQPIADANVELLMPTNAEYLYFWTADPEWERVGFLTGESGEFAFDDIPDGRYEVRASHPNYVAVAVSSVKVLDHRQEPSSLALRMRRGDSGVWGQIWGSENLPQAGTNVTISSGSCFVTYTTDKDGFYSAARLPPGDYVMTVNAKGLADRRCQFSLSPSQQLRYDVALAGTASVEGEIVTSKSLHLAQWLPIILRSDRLVLRNESRPFGGFWYEFRSLPPGRYELEVLSDMLGNVRYSVSLMAGETRRLDINLEGYGNLTGQVIGRDASPLPGAPLKVISSGGEVSTTSDPEGRYRVANLPPGCIQLSIPEGKFAGTWCEFELPRSERMRPSDTVWDIDLSSLGDVSGHVLKADGRPLGPAVLRIESPQRSVEAVTDREGRFRAEGLFPGRCRIHLPVPHLGQAYCFELAPKEQKELKILLPP
ncbi:MAG: sigma-70 family RNA polymerase sigma factor [bacterium]|nr:sigma-70 family RNA polymerase sigma factor [bacterium]